MKQTTIVAIVLGVLVIVSAVQSFQLSKLKEKVASGQLSLGSSTGSSSSGTNVASGSGKTGALPDNIKNLPQMVGGC